MIPKRVLIALLMLCLGAGCPVRSDDDDVADDDDSAADDDDATGDDDDATGDDDDATADDDDATGDDDDATADDDDATADDDDATGDDDDATGDDDDATPPDPCPAPISICGGGDCLQDIDLDPVRVTGLLQWDGAAIPQNTNNDFSLLFTDVVTGNVLEVQRDASTGPVSTYDVPMLPGTYDVAFSWRIWPSPTSSSWPDPILGAIPVATNFVVPAGGASLNVEPDPVRVTGLLQWDGAAIPQNTNNDFSFVFVDVTTGNELIVQRDASTGAVNTYDIPMIPGTYDVFFQWDIVPSPTSSAWPDPVYGRIPVATSFTVPAGGASLNVEPDPVRVTGLLQWDGAPISQNTNNDWEIVFEDVSSDRVFTVPRDAASGAVSTYDIPMIPGTYDVSFAWTITPSPTSSAWPDPILGELPIVSSFTVPAGGASLNIEPDPVRVTGLLSWDGAPVPQNANNDWSLVFTDLATDRVFTVERDASQGAVNTFDIPMLPGTYAVDWQWRISPSPTSAAWADPVYGLVPISSSFTVPAGGGSLNIEPDPARLTGLLQWDGAAIPQNTNNDWSLVFTPSGGGAPLSVPRDASSGAVSTFDVPVFPGSWDVDFVWAITPSPTSSAWPDPILGSLDVGSVTVPAGGATMNIEPDPLRQTGLLLWDGAAIPQNTNNDWRIVWVDPYEEGESLVVERDASQGAVNTYDVPAWPGVYHLEFQWAITPSPTSSAWPDPILGSLRVATCVLVQ